MTLFDKTALRCLIPNEQMWGDSGEAKRWHPVGTMDTHDGSLVGKTSRELAGVAKHDGGQIHGQEKKENIPEDSTTSSTIEDFCAGSSMFSWRSLA